MTEYPGFEEHSGTPDDKESFRLLLDEVRTQLDILGSQTGRFYGLTAGELKLSDLITSNNI